MSKKKRLGGSQGHREVRNALLGKYVKLGARADAELLARKILGDDPSQELALRTCIESELAAGHYAAALPLCERLVTLRADDAWARLQLGVCRAQTTGAEAALNELLAAAQLSPDDAAVCGHLSTVYFDLGRYELSLQYADRSVASDPSNFSAHNARGAALLKLQRYQEALLALAKAIELYPGDYYGDAVGNLGLVLHDMRHYAESYACHEEIIRLNPADTGSLALLVHSAMQICLWANFDSRVKQLLDAIRADSPPIGIAPFIYLGVPGMTRDDHRRMAKLAAGTMLSAKVQAAPRPEALPGLLPQRDKIRVGYLSADFHQHATSQLLAEVIERHDRSRFDISAYSYGPDDGSPMRARMRAAFDHFHDIAELSWEAAADAIRKDGIDILVDLKGWTHDARLDILAVRPAPVIVSWLGYPGTLGAPGMADYIIGDPCVTPLAHADGYSETIVQLPHSYQPNDRRRQVGETPSRQALGLPERGVVFCSFNQSYKISRDMFSIWCDILLQIRDSVLWLLQPDDAAAENLRLEFVRRGLGPERLIFAPRCALEDHLGRLQQASVALDTAPYGSHTTGSDALWVGVPLVTCPGETFASRVAASLLQAAGVPELIADSREGYISLAVKLGTDAVALARIKEKLRAGRDLCPLFDSQRFTRNLEKSYQRMVQDGRAGRRDAIVIQDAVEHLEEWYRAES